ncbi:MAG TPA: hypothetical protein P5561_04265 [Candidatus Omnitrophota bacterium]|nr:hypothetical protein [Candidatus Omnitrophota bacterium]HRY85725.1 hypothetical protein [Candidatus Omnitrophota bacterium]
MQKKEKIQLGVIAVAGIALLLMLPPFFQKQEARGKKGKVPQAPAAAATSVKAASPGPGEQVIKLPAIKDDKFYERLSRVAEVLPLERDPFFFAYTGPRSPRDGLDLTGILWEGTQPTAIINQSFLKVGDTTEQFSVVNILQDKVILKDANGEFELRLKK